MSRVPFERIRPDQAIQTTVGEAGVQSEECPPDLLPQFVSETETERSGAFIASPHISVEVTYSLPQKRLSMLRAFILMINYLIV